MVLLKQKRGQQFEIDIEVSAYLASPIDCNDIKETINCTDLYDKVVILFSEKKYKLIESFAHKISTSITNKFNVGACKVIILKPNLPINGILNAVEVEVNKIV